MVFSINSDESSGRSYAAFQSLAKQLNGSSAAAASPSASSTPNGAASTVPALGAITVALGALVAAFL